MKRIFAVSAVLALLARSSPAATCSPSTFLKAASFPTGNYPDGIATGDFNNDGKLDVVTINANDPSLSFLPGNGDGTFGPPIASPTNYNPGQITTGYFDPDGNLDIAISFGGAIQVLLGNGDGTFQPPAGYDAGSSPTGLVAGDFTGDGIIDLAEASQYTTGILVLPGVGDGTFAAAVLYPMTVAPQSLAAGDFNGDGRTDLAVPLSDNTLAVFLALPNGALGTPSFLKVGFNLRSVTTADLNGDGKVDIAVGVDVYLAIFHGNGDGTFQAAVEYPIGFSPLALVAADFNGDGLVDLSALKAYYSSTGTVSILLQQADGSLLLEGAFQAGLGTMALASGDFDGDGNTDLATADSTNDAVSILLGEGDGSLQAAPVALLDAQPRILASGDFNGDGHLDVVALGGSYDGPVQLLLGDGSGGFAKSWSVEVFAYPNGVAVADFNADGRLDFAVTTQYSGLVVFIGNGDGTFQDPVQYSTPSYAITLVVNDFDGDGVPDLVVADNASVNGELDMYLGNGDGTFRPGATRTLTRLPSALISADLNGDGKPDVAASNGSCCGSGADSVSVLLGNGDGTLQAPVIYAAGPLPVSLAVGDFNGDGLADLLLADSAPNVSLLLGTGGGAFASPTLIGIGWNPFFVAVGDFNADGKLDAVTADTNDSRVSLLTGTGTGGFQLPVSYVTGSSPSSLLPGSFHPAGAPDVVVANAGDYTLTVLLNTRLGASPVENTSVLVGSPAVLSAPGAGFGPVTYQWRRDGIPLSDGGTVSGSTTATLTIDPAAFADAASYDVLVSDSCATVASGAGVLAVEFADVPVSNIFHADIITIATNGITAGCGGADYCPSSLVTRGQMAVFLLKSEHGAAYVPPACAGLFADVPCPSTYANWIEQLSNEGVTAGCGNGDYCPDASVTRAQMAVFLLKTSLGSGYVPPAATAIFADVPVGAFAAAFIDDLYTRGIAGGCSSSPLLYCPNNVVNRAPMAAFLVNTFF